jgi:hypothetical protein
MGISKRHSAREGRRSGPDLQLILKDLLVDRVADSTSAKQANESGPILFPILWIPKDQVGQSEARPTMERVQYKNRTEIELHWYCLCSSSGDNATVFVLSAKQMQSAQLSGCFTRARNEDSEYGGIHFQAPCTEFERGSINRQPQRPQSLAIPIGLVRELQAPIDSANFHPPANRFRRA